MSTAGGGDKYRYRMSTSLIYYFSLRSHLHRHVSITSIHKNKKEHRLFWFVIRAGMDLNVYA